MLVTGGLGFIDSHSVVAVIHFTASKALGKSAKNLKYFRNNLFLLANLFEIIKNTSAIF